MSRALKLLAGWTGSLTGLAIAVASPGCGESAPTADPCAPHGESHGDHCDCDPGYREQGRMCLPTFPDAGPADAPASSFDAGGGADAWELDCGPHGHAHADHCHCDAGFVEVDGMCSEPPPCLGPDDALEENDTPETASPAPSGMVSLHSCNVDDDWYFVELAAGGRVDVSVAFAHASSDIDVYLFAPGADPRHDEPLASSDSTDDDEVLSFTATTAGRYNFLVHGYDAREAPYTLSVSTTSP